MNNYGVICVIVLFIMSFIVSQCVSMQASPKLSLDENIVKNMLGQDSGIMNLQIVFLMKFKLG